MIEALLDPANVIIALGSVGAFLTIIAFGTPLLAGSALDTRLKAVAKRREELGRAQRASLSAKTSSLRQQQGKGYITYIVDRLKLINPTDSDDIRNKLAQAGLRSRAHLYTYSFFRFVAPIIFGLATAGYLFAVEEVKLDTIGKLTIAFGGALIGFYLPQVLLKNRIQRRQTAMQKVFADALDLMVICVEAGLSMEAAFNRVAEEIQEPGPELSEEIGLTTAELAFLPDRRQALINFAERTGLPAVKALVTSLIQAEKYGTPISVSLRVLGQEQRDERLSRAERKAGALPAQLTVPMIVFFLPVLFVVLLGPAIIQALATF